MISRRRLILVILALAKGLLDGPLLLAEHVLALLLVDVLAGLLGLEGLLDRSAEKRVIVGHDDRFRLNGKQPVHAPIVPAKIGRRHQTKV